MAEMKQDRLAIDRGHVESARTFDDDGHLHVKDVPISKANVCPYNGREIPNWQELGLNPDRVYQLLRDPEELAKGAATFNGKPLLDLHPTRANTAQDNNRQQTVGSVHNVHWDPPYLRAGDFHVWDGGSIAGIQDDAQSQLSSSYRYDADMTPGVYQGVAHDGTMRNIRANHVALVPEGRAGSDVVVNDAALPDQPTPTPHNQEITMAKTAIVSRQALLASGAIRAYLRPKLANDAKVDLTPMLQGVTGKNWKAEKPKIKVALDAAVAGKLAKDADMSDVQDALDDLDDAIEDVKEEVSEASVNEPSDEPTSEDDVGDDTVATKLKAMGLTDEQVAAILPLCTASTATPVMDEKKEPPKGMDKPAMDAAIARAATATVTVAVDAAVARVNALHVAKAAVAPIVGEVVGMDSADQVFGFALKQEGYDLTGIPAAAFRPMFDQHVARRTAVSQPVRIANDAARSATLLTRIPGLGRIKLGG